MIAAVGLGQFVGESLAPTLRGFMSNWLDQSDFETNWCQQVSWVTISWGHFKLLDKIKTDKKNFLK